MPGLRTATIILSDVELVAALHGLSMLGFTQLWHARWNNLNIKAFPPLYQSGVRYQREPIGSEVWQGPRESYASKKADCEDLAAGWRVPELWMSGETAAYPKVIRINAVLRHVVLVRADGTEEDPSVILGMSEKREPGSSAREREKVKPVMKTPSVKLPFGLPDPNSLV